MKIDVDSAYWLLNRIKDVESRPNWNATHHTIWAGCYDVRHCEQDRIDAINIPLLRMKSAEEAGLIRSERKQKGKIVLVVWTLTEDGEKFFEEERRKYEQANEANKSVNGPSTQ